LKYTLDNWRLVKFGTSEAQRRLFFGMRKQQHVLESHGIEPDSRNLAAALNVKEKDVVLMMERASGAEAPLDAPRGSPGRDERSLADTLGDVPALQPDLQLESADFGQHLRDRLKIIEDTLAGRELAIFRRRLLCDEPDTLAELARDFGVSRERTRQLESRLKGRILTDLTSDFGDALEIGRKARRLVTSASIGPRADAFSTVIRPDRRSTRPAAAMGHS
jgi:RNA polymerase sigma-32 factor